MLRQLQQTRALGLLSRTAAPSMVVPRAAALQLAGRRLVSTQPDPQSKAQSIIDALPGNSPLSKSGILLTGFAGATFAIANSLYVVNAETILLGVFAAIVLIGSKTVAPAYREWAQGHIQHITKSLNEARAEHVGAVQDRIDNVNQLSEVVQTTKSLFAVSKETVELEAKAFELKQKVDVAARAKEVLDSWVRYEANVRQREQKELAASVIKNVEATLSEPKVQDQILKQAVADVEKLFKSA